MKFILMSSILTIMLLFNISCISHEWGSIKYKHECEVGIDNEIKYINNSLNKYLYDCNNDDKKSCYKINNTNIEIYKARQPYQIDRNKYSRHHSNKINDYITIDSYLGYNLYTAHLSNPEILVQAKILDIKNIDMYLQIFEYIVKLEHLKIMNDDEYNSYYLRNYESQYLYNENEYSSNSGKTHVRGYYRKNGTYVKSHYRRSK